MEQFRKLGINESILKVIAEEHFTEPSEIQTKSIPLILSGKDVIGGAATGSGKTLAFGSGVIAQCERGKGLQSLILTPTRELSEQVCKALIKFSRYKQLNILPVYGGVGIGPQIQYLPRADIVVGTPGRILDHLERRTIDLRAVKILVLDEADQMLDMGFIEDVEKIIRFCPRERQTLLFSATINRDVEHLARKHMKSPVSVSAIQYVDASKLSQKYYDVEDPMKFSLLAHLLKQEHEGVVMVFCNSRRTVDFVTKNLKYQNMEVLAIHGGLSQNKRNNALERFHDGRVFVLVCTDVAARGLDIKGVSHVYNYDIPKDSKQYTHRIGRTARAGETGKAVSLLGQRDHESFRRLLRESPSKITREEAPKFERVQVQMADRSQGPRRGPPRFGNRGGGGFRGSRNRGSSRPSSDWRGSQKRHHGGFDRR